MYVVLMYGGMCEEMYATLMKEKGFFATYTYYIKHMYMHTR